MSFSALVRFEAGNPLSPRHPGCCWVFGVPVAPPNCDEHTSADTVTCPWRGTPPPWKLLVSGESHPRAAFSGRDVRRLATRR